ncbi:MAG: DUF5618 family protein [Bacteroidetes bacterium]|nr:DUF5618 family protein [Bacteroidota bacterium]
MKATSKTKKSKKSSLRGVEHPAIQEAMRYIENAREILKDKAKKQGRFYNDPKYVKMAGNTAWNGVLVALDAIVPPKPKKQRMDIDWYKEYLAKHNKTVLKEFVSGYNYMHLYMGYDGDLGYVTAQNGLEMAENIIEWVAKRVA